MIIFQVCIAAVGLVGDLSRALGQKILPYCDEIMMLLLENLGVGSHFFVDCYQLYQHINTQSSIANILVTYLIAPHCCGAESRQGLWILSCEEAIQLAYEMSLYYSDALCCRNNAQNGT
jgi:hypothetical protein